MMGDVSPETCWASYKHGIINIYTLLHFVGYFSMNCDMMHGSTNIKHNRRVTALQKIKGFCKILSIFGIFSHSTLHQGGTRWSSLLRHCATSRKTADSTPDGVIAIFFIDHTMNVASTQPLTETSTRNTSLGVQAAGV